MKRNNPFFRSGRLSSFTLVELLVVMGIIAILAGVLFAGATAAIRAAQRAKAANLANQIQTAAMNYYGEYNVYPICTNAPTVNGDMLISDSTTSAAYWKATLYGLCANVNPYDNSTTAPAGAIPNSRTIQFLTMKTSDVDANGGPKNPLPFSAKNPYFNLAIDANYDGTTSNMPTAIVPSGAMSGGVAVWANCNTSTGTTNANFIVRTF